MKTTFFKRGLWPVILSLLLGQTGLAAVNFTVMPPAISNTYSGTIVLQVTGLTNTETVVVQKYLDANANGVVDAPDLLVQQFNLTDGQAGMVIGGVTNINVPGDVDGSANGQITATLNFQNGDFIQNIIGNFLFKLSSPVGHFSAITSSFNVTNFPYSQKFNGNVVNSGTNVPNAVVILFPPPRAGDHGPGTPVAEVVANNSGGYSVQVPVGSYVPLAFKNNYVANLSASPLLTLSGGQTITTNLTLTNATQTISGKMVDANNSSIALPGIWVPASTKDGLIAIGFTDTNGNFTIPVTANQWQIEGEPQGLILHGYVGYQNGLNADTTGGSVSGLTGAFSKATALFYGHGEGDPDRPFPGIDIEASDHPDSGDGTYSSDGYTDANGNYVVGVVGGLGSGDLWELQAANNSNPSNYVFSQSQLGENGGTNINAGQAVQQNFTALLATNHITGNVQFNGTNVVGVQVSATATINGLNYQEQMDTDGNGNYSMTVANGTWNVSVLDCCDDDSLDNILGSGNYQTPSSQNITINNNNGTANFTVPSCSGVQIVTTSLPDGTNGVYYYQLLSASSCSGNITWSINSGSLPSNFTLDQVGELFGTPNSSGTFNFIVHADDGNGHSTNQSLSLYIAPVSSPLQITTTFLPEGTNTLFYSQTLQSSGGTPPYSWAIADYSAAPPPNLTLATNGVLSGTPSATPSSEVGSYLFDVVVTDTAANSSTNTLSLYIVNPPLAPLVITNISLPNGNVGAAYSAQLGATGGQSPYFWSYAPASQNLSAIGLSLNSNGLISGTPTTNRVFSFKVQVTDSNVSDPPTNKVLSITINSKPDLKSPAKTSSSQFQFLLSGAASQNYTLQYSSNLLDWTSLFVTNNPATNSFLVIVPNATNAKGFYRLLIGP